MTLPPSKNFLGLDRERSHFERAKAVIVPVPFEHPRSDIRGTRLGPAAILAASHRLSPYDEETGRDVSAVAGIATLAPLELSRKSDEASLDRVHSTVADLLARGKFVVTLGGEHGLTGPIVAAHAKRSPQVSVLHFDARPDLRPARKGDHHDRLSAMARIGEFVDPKRIVQAGIRSVTPDEADVLRDGGFHVYYAHAIRSGAYTRLLRTWDDHVVDELTDEVYVTIDMGVFDPSVIPATSVPEPGGLGWYDVTQCLRKVAAKRTIVGCDVVELIPHPAHPAANVAAARLVHKILTYVL